MTMQRDSTEGFSLVPEARYNFTVMGKPEKFRAGKTTYRKWILITEIAGKRKEIHVNLFPWKSEELIIAVGGRKEGKDLVWDDDKVDGQKFVADLKHEAYKKNDGSDGTGYLLTNFGSEEEIPF